MVLEENSLVILKSAEGRSPVGPRRASLIVLDGTLRGRIGVGRGAPGTVELVAGTGTAGIRPDTRPSEFTVTVHDDRSSTFSVFAGSAQVVSGRGAIVVATNQSVTVDAQGVAGTVVPLPPAPEPLAPPQGWRQRYHTTRTRVGFRWSAGGSATGYRLNVARDPGFEDLVVSERIATPDFTLGNLRAGRYYWRVRCVRGDLEGSDSPTRDFVIVQDTKPPDLTVNFPNGVVREREIRLSGTTRPGAKVFIVGEQVPVGRTGGFTHTLGLKRGANVVVVEAVDDTGNVAYRSHIVNANY
jgi:Glucodextranase, domain B